MALEARVRDAAALTGDERDQMFALMETYYRNCDRGHFEQDLRLKDWVILLTDDGTVAGFSSQRLLRHRVNGSELTVLFSGDTVIHKRRWGSGLLPVTWVRLVLSLAAADPDRPLYWLLTTKGFMTYRFLPVFFKEYYPRRDTPIPPFERELIETLGVGLFPDRFDPQAGVLLSATGAQRLKGGVAEITDKRRDDPEISFFERANPGHAEGDELVCIARCDESNLKPFILRRARR